MGCPLSVLSHPPPFSPFSRTASAARLQPALAALATAAASITARAAGAPSARWPEATLRAVDAAAVARDARCVCWDDGGDGAGCAPLMVWIAWDWSVNAPREGGGGGDALSWRALASALGPPLLPASPLPHGEVAAWLDGHTVRVHGVWREGGGGGKGAARPAV